MSNPRHLICPPSKRGHTWQEAINDPRARTCRDCGALGRIDDNGQTKRASDER